MDGQMHPQEKPCWAHLIDREVLTGPALSEHRLDTGRARWIHNLVEPRINALGVISFIYPPEEAEDDVNPLVGVKHEDETTAIYRYGELIFTCRT